MKLHSHLCPLDFYRVFDELVLETDALYCIRERSNVASSVAEDGDSGFVFLSLLSLHDRRSHCARNKRAWQQRLIAIFEGNDCLKSRDGQILSLLCSVQTLA